MNGYYFDAVIHIFEHYKKDFSNVGFTGKWRKNDEKLSSLRRGYEKI